MVVNAVIMKENLYCIKVLTSNTAPVVRCRTIMCGKLSVVKTVFKFVVFA